MKTDALMTLLMRRGDTAEHAYEQVEAVAQRTADGANEIEAIIAVIGFCPHEIRTAIESQTTSQKEAL